MPQTEQPATPAEKIARAKNIVDTSIANPDLQKGIFETAHPSNKADIAKKIGRQILTGTAVGITSVACRAGLVALTGGMSEAVVAAAGGFAAGIRTNIELSTKGWASLMAENAMGDALTRAKTGGVVDKALLAPRVYSAVDTFAAQRAALTVDRFILGLTNKNLMANAVYDFAEVAFQTYTGSNATARDVLLDASALDGKLATQAILLSHLLIAREHGYSTIGAKDSNRYASNEQIAARAHKLDELTKELNRIVFDKLSRLQASTEPNADANFNIYINYLSSTKRGRLHRGAVGAAYGFTRIGAGALKSWAIFKGSEMASDTFGSHSKGALSTDQQPGNQAPAAPTLVPKEQPSTGSGPIVGPDTKESGSTGGVVTPPIDSGTPPDGGTGDLTPPEVVQPVILTPDYAIKSGDTVGAVVKQYLTNNHVALEGSIWDIKNAQIWGGLLLNNRNNVAFWDHVHIMAKNNPNLLKALEQYGYAEGKGIKAENIDLIISKAAKGDMESNRLLHEVFSKVGVGDKLVLNTEIPKDVSLQNLESAHAALEKANAVKESVKKLANGNDAIRLDDKTPTAGHAIRHFRENIVKWHESTGAPKPDYAPLFGNGSGPTWGNFLEKQLPTPPNGNPEAFTVLRPEQYDTWHEMSQMFDRLGDSTLKDLGLRFEYTDNQELAVFDNPEKIRQLIDLAKKGNLEAIKTIQRIFSKLPKGALLLKSEF